MLILQNLQWTGPTTGSLLSLILLAACGGPGSAPPATAYQNTYIRDRLEVSVDDLCAPKNSPFASAAGWMNCAGAALAAPVNAETSDPFSFRYARQAPDRKPR
jgi:hypothetical protein